MSSQQTQPDDSPQAAPTPSHLRQLALQFAAVFAVLSLAWPYFLIQNKPLPSIATVFAIGGAAFILAKLTRQPWWWQLIHALFAPLAWFVHELPINPSWFFLIFILLLLVYRGALTGQIPLYLSNNDTADVLTQLISERPRARFIDLGAGIASIVRPLAIALPEATFDGIENAPITWIIGLLRTARLKNCCWQWGDLWSPNLKEYDIVYAFLSPAPMPALWKKIQNEMRPGSLFISNSFPVPGIEASTIIDIDDARQSRLYCYQR